MAIFECRACGHVELASPVATCPACQAGDAPFVGRDRVFSEARRQYPGEYFRHIPDVRIRLRKIRVSGKRTLAIQVKLESLYHPMTEAHRILFIDYYRDERFFGRTEFDTRGTPHGRYFYLDRDGKKITVVERCSLHGFWRIDILIPEAIFTASAPMLEDTISFNLAEIQDLAAAALRVDETDFLETDPNRISLQTVDPQRSGRSAAEEPRPKPHHHPH